MHVGDIAHGTHQHERDHLTRYRRELLPKEVNINTKLTLTTLACDQLVIFKDVSEDRTDDERRSTVANPPEDCKESSLHNHVVADQHLEASGDRKHQVPDDVRFVLADAVYEAEPEGYREQFKHEQPSTQQRIDSIFIRRIRRRRAIELVFRVDNVRHHKGQHSELRRRADRLDELVQKQHAEDRVA